MDDACLNHRFGEDGRDGVVKTLQAIDEGPHDILEHRAFNRTHSPLL
jgi:hypothetical protein